MKISVITITYNDVSGLIATIESLVNQSYLEVEHIIVDGKSKDNTIVVIKDYETKINELGLNISLKWISEPDTGIYNAMNKGVKMSSGEYLLFLNSGDTLANNDVIKDLQTDELNADVVIGRINVVNSENIVVNKDYTITKPLTLFTFYLRGIPHQGTLIRRTLQLENLYDESYRINSDFKFFLKVLILENRTIQYIEHTIANYDNTGISSTNQKLQVEERKKIFAELVPERIRMNYEKVFPHYYEVTRIEWLLKHPIYYRIYRVFVTLCRKISL